MKWLPPLLLFLCLSTPNEAAYTLKGAHHIKSNTVPKLTAEEYYRLGSAAIHAEDWRVAAKQFYLASFYYPETTYGQDAHFYLGIAYYHLQEFDFANEAFSTYLNCQTNPRFFREAIQNKFSIAEHFRNGELCRVLSTKQLPKWASGKALAIDIFDEVIAALPNQELAIQALFAKACLLWEQRLYREGVEAFQTLIRRYPKHELAPESYLLINKLYQEQCQREFQNPDLLAFAKINLRKFEEAFPREERLESARDDLLSIKEIYAQGFFNTASFYERINEPKAAVMYYHMAMTKFPETKTADECKNCLARLDPRTFGRKDLQSEMKAPA
ncbi:MAG: outer membrane protein assembly factor BamD [Waddliaceae bacterium]